MQNKPILVVDLDGVIFDSLPLIDEIVGNIDIRATDKYLRQLEEREEKIRKKINQLEYERVNDCDDIKMDLLFELDKVSKLKREHYDYKDQVLEEVYPMYKGLIDYFEIYQFKHTFPMVFETLVRVWEGNVFDRIIGESHYNVDCESDAKRFCLLKDLPFMEFLPVKFHIQPYFNQLTGEKNDRIRSNKIEQLSYYLKIVNRGQLPNLKKVYFVDDTLSIIREAQKAGVEHCYFKSPEANTNSLLREAYFDANNEIITDKVKRLELK